MTTVKEFAAFLAKQKKNADLKNAITLYENTGDGRYFWRAFLKLHTTGEPIPPEFLDKFAQIGERLLSANSPGEIAAALEFAGHDKGHIGPKQSSSYEGRWRIASQVQRVHQQGAPGLSLADAKRLVAHDIGLTFASMSKAYHGVFTSPVNRPQAKPLALDAVLRGWLK